MCFFKFFRLNWANFIKFVGLRNSPPAPLFEGKRGGNEGMWVAVVDDFKKLIGFLLSFLLFELGNANMVLGLKNSPLPPSLKERSGVNERFLSFFKHLSSLRTPLLFKERGRG